MADGEKLPDLKPCPFCGGEAKFERKEGSYGYFPPAVRVACATRVPQRDPYGSKPCFAKTDWFDTDSWVIRDVSINQAAASWNARVEVSRG